MFTLFIALLHIWCAPTWRFHTELCKFLRNISTNFYGLGERTDLKLGEVSSLFIFNRFTISWLYPLNGFRFIFLLRDSGNDLYACAYTRIGLTHITRIFWFGYIWAALYLHHEISMKFRGLVFRRHEKFTKALKMVISISDWQNSWSMKIQCQPSMNFMGHENSNWPWNSHQSISGSFLQYRFIKRKKS